MVRAPDTITLAGFEGVIEVNTTYWQIAVLMIVVGAGSGIFNSPNTCAIMNSVGPEHRGIANGTRTFLTNIGGMLSIALALSIITSALPRGQMFKIFSGTAGHGMSAAASFMSGFHEALLVGAAASLIGAAFSALRGKSVIMAPFTRESHHAWRSSSSRSDHAPLLTSGRSGAHDK